MWAIVTIFARSCQRSCAAWSLGFGAGARILALRFFPVILSGAKDLATKVRFLQTKKTLGLLVKLL